MSDEQKAIVAAVLRELAQLFRKVESQGDYIGPDEEYVESAVSTIIYLGSDLEDRADELDRGAPLVGKDE